MGHLVYGKEEAYQALAERLSRFPIGAVINETLMGILKLLYTETEAAVGSKFPVKPRPLAEIVEMTGMGEQELAPILENMASKGLVVDIPRKGTTYYMLSPMVVGFFEYTLMRAGGANLRELAHLFERYFHDADVAEELFGSKTRLFRTLVYERIIPALVETEVLSYEKASQLIRDSGGGGLSLCACRHKASHLGKPCRYPMEDICTSLGRPAEWLVRRGFARAATVDDLLRNLERSYKLGLVLTADNVIDEPAYICHCCGCCCGPLQAIKEYRTGSIQPSNFFPAVDRDNCTACGTCEDSCQIGAITLDDDDGPVIDTDFCLGCGVCAAACPDEALRMERRRELYTPPQNKIEQLTVIAMERGRF